MELKKPESDFWDKGDKALIARLSGISPTILTNVLSRNRSIGKEMALVLEAASTAIGKRIDAFDWLFNVSTDHPAFNYEPKYSKKLEQALKRISNIKKTYTK